MVLAPFNNFASAQFFAPGRGAQVRMEIRQVPVARAQVQSTTSRSSTDPCKTIQDELDAAYKERQRIRERTTFRSLNDALGKIIPSQEEQQKDLAAATKKISALQAQLKKCKGAALTDPNLPPRDNLATTGGSSGSVVRSQKVQTVPLDYRPMQPASEKGIMTITPDAGDGKVFVTLEFPFSIVENLLLKIETKKPLGNLKEFTAFNGTFGKPEVVNTTSEGGGTIISYVKIPPVGFGTQLFFKGGDPDILSITASTESGQRINFTPGGAIGGGAGGQGDGDKDKQDPCENITDLAQRKAAGCDRNPCEEERDPATRKKLGCGDEEGSGADTSPVKDPCKNLRDELDALYAQQQAIRARTEFGSLDGAIGKRIPSMEEQKKDLDAVAKKIFELKEKLKKCKDPEVSHTPPPVPPITRVIDPEKATYPGLNDTTVTDYVSGARRITDNKTGTSEYFPPPQEKTPAERAAEEKAAEDYRKAYRAAQTTTASPSTEAYKNQKVAYNTYRCPTSVYQSLFSWLPLLQEAQKRGILV